MSAKKFRTTGSKNKTHDYRVFVSHGWTDRWVAEQIAVNLKSAGADTFLDVFDIEKGDDFEDRIFTELPKCRELIALLTPWSVDRNWVWVEIGAARALKLRVVAVMYGVTLSDLDKEKGGKAFLGSKNVVEINELGSYIAQVHKRIT